MKVEKFFKNSFILMLSNLVTGVINFIFSILISKKLGTEGLGLYGIIMPIYVFLQCLVSDGLITAISRISTIYYGKEDYHSIKKTTNTALATFLTWSIVIAFMIYQNSGFVAYKIIKDKRSIDAVKAICPAIIFISLSSIIKGFFYGISQFKVSSIIDISEKILRVISFTFIVDMLALTTIKSTVTAAYSALTVGELTSLTILYIFYRIYSGKMKAPPKSSESHIQIIIKILSISIPLCLEGLFTSVLYSVSTLILPQRLTSIGLPYSEALSLIGKFKGMALTIAYFPIIIVSSMSTVMVPEITLNMSKGYFWKAENRVSQILKIDFLVGLSTMIVCFCIPNDLGKLFYNRSDLGFMIEFAASCTIVDYISIPTIGILNGLGKPKIILRNSVIESTCAVVFIYVLSGIKQLNIYGYGISIILTSTILLLLNMHEIKKDLYIRIKPSKMFLYIFIGLLSFSILKLANNIVPLNILPLKALFNLIFGFILVFFLSKLIDKRNIKTA